MTTYPDRTAVSLGATAQALYAAITGESSDLAERLALLSLRAKSGALPADVEAVRHRLWAEHDPGPPRPYTARGHR